MLPTASRSAIPIRTHPQPQPQPPQRILKHRPCTSVTEISSHLASTKPPSQERPSKRPMHTPTKTIAVVNSSGRQAASLIRVASAVGYRVRAQLRNLEGIVATEIASLENVTVLVGELYMKQPALAGAVNHELIAALYKGAQLAFINTTFWGDEVAIGKALADAAVTAGIEHYIYSTMPNHALHNPAWPSLPLWSSKATIEAYIHTLPSLYAKTTFLYTGIYNNNFTSLPYPLFCMELQPDGSFEWAAPFHPDVRLPWLDAEHDVGPAVLQLIKDGVERWGHGERIALAYEVLSPCEACHLFSQGVGRPVRYRSKPKIEVKVKIPDGYREQLLALEKMYAIGEKDGSLQPLYFGIDELEKSCPAEAMELWEGYRGLEEYAREVFPLEEAANGLTWMNEEVETQIITGVEKDSNEDANDSDEGLAISGGDATPARREEGWLA